MAESARRARKAGKFNISQLEEPEELKEDKKDKTEELMKEIRALGYIPKHHSEHDLLAQRYHKAVKSGKLCPQRKEEAEALTAAHTALLAQSMDPPRSMCATGAIGCICR